MPNIQLTFPDGTTKEFPQGVRALEVAKAIGPRLAAESLAARVDGRLVDLSSPLNESAPIQFITPNSPEGLEIYRHSSAHLLAAAVLELFPDALLPGQRQVLPRGFRRGRFDSCAGT